MITKGENNIKGIMLYDIDRDIEIFFISPSLGNMNSWGSPILRGRDLKNSPQNAASFSEHSSTC